MSFENAQTMSAQESEAILNDPQLLEELAQTERTKQEQANVDAENKAAEAEGTIATSWEDVPEDDIAVEWKYNTHWKTWHLLQAMTREQRDALERDFSKEDPNDENKTVVERIGFASAVVALTWVKPTLADVAALIESHPHLAPRRKEFERAAVERDPATGERLRVVVGPQARAKLQRKNGEAVMELYDVGARLSGLRKADREKIKGNSAGDRGTTSSTASQSTDSK